MTGRPMSDAPTDGTEILVRDDEGHFAIVAYALAGSEIGFSRSAILTESGWFRKAEGTWDLFDGFREREVYNLIEWWPLPPQ
jgi:hypothetical protein